MKVCLLTGLGGSLYNFWLKRSLLFKGIQGISSTYNLLVLFLLPFQHVIEAQFPMNL